VLTVLVYLNTYVQVNQLFLEVGKKLKGANSTNANSVFYVAHESMLHFVYI